MSPPIEPAVPDPGRSVPWLALVALPWLLPVHQAPWPTFHAEAAMGVALLVPLLALLLHRGPRWEVGVPETCLLALAGVPWLQAQSGLFVHPAESWTVGICIASFAMAVLLGRHAQAVWPLVLADSLFAALGLAALLSAGLAAYQWLELDHLGMLVASLGTDGRIRANVGHPNNLSTLLGWGLVALFWLQQGRRVGAWTAVAGALLLLFGMALTQSRTGWLQVAVLAVMAWHWRTEWSDHRCWKVVAALAAAFAAMVISLDALSQMLSHDVALTLQRQTEAGKRPQIWNLGLQAVAARPWWGWGWNQGVTAHVALADRFPDLHVAVGHMHDIVLDLLVWNGLPLGIVLCVAAAVWWRNRLCEPRDARQALLLAALAVLGVHALLELPHLYAFFYLPAGLMIGMLSGRVAQVATFRLPAGAVAAVAAALAAWLVLAVQDYSNIEQGLLSFRLHELNVGLGELPPPPRPRVLVSLQQEIEDQRVVAKRGMDAASLDRLRASASRTPTVGLLFRHARASALNDRPEEARWALRRICAMHRPQDCEDVRRDWCQAAGRETELKAIGFPVPGVASTPASAEAGPGCGSRPP